MKVNVCGFESCYRVKYKTNDIEMIKGDIEIRCNDCSTSFFIPAFNILLGNNALEEV